MITLLSRLFRPVPPPPAAARPSRPPDDGGDDDIPRGCGWFDSSHDLLSGVVVWEGIIVVDNTTVSPS